MIRKMTTVLLTTRSQSGIKARSILHPPTILAYNLRLYIKQRYINYSKPAKRQKEYELHVILRINSNMFVFNKLNRFICIRLSNANKIQTINPEIMNKTTRLLGSLLIITIATSCGTGGKKSIRTNRRSFGQQPDSRSICTGRNRQK